MTVAGEVPVSEARRPADQLAMSSACSRIALATLASLGIREGVSDLM
jgi:hypothetical protein